MIIRNKKCYICNNFSDCRRHSCIGKSCDHTGIAQYIGSEKDQIAGRFPAGISLALKAPAPVEFKIKQARPYS